MSENKKNWLLLFIIIVIALLSDDLANRIF